nr:hypothetical protein [Tanacetum cinerariifolium]
LFRSEREFRSCWKLFKTLTLDKSRSHVFDLFCDLEENFEEEVIETMAETMEECMSKTRVDYGPGVTRPKIDGDLEDRGVALIVTSSSSSRTISMHLLTSAISSSNTSTCTFSSNFCFLDLLDSSSSLGLFELSTALSLTALESIATKLFYPIHSFVKSLLSAEILKALMIDLLITLTMKKIFVSE